jgi:hypothetical protein
VNAGRIAALTHARSVEVGERVQSLWGGYGEIRRVRLDGAPAIVKAVLPPPRGDTSHQRKLRSYDVELAWYRRYAERSPSRVPRLIAGDKCEDGWLFVLEDLDAAGYAGRDGPVDRCLEWLARFHLAFLGVEPDGLWAQGTYWHVSTRLEELPRIEDPAIREAAPAIDARLRASSFRTIVHGDAKVPNFCFGDGGVAAVDFQYVGAGCAMSDVAYLICGDDDEERKLERYFAHLTALGGAPELEREGRAIYPFAAADYYRWYAGWAPARWREERHGQRVLADAIARL